MAVYLSPVGNGFQWLNTAGQVLSGGKINTYFAGTTSPISTFTDSSGATPNANPIILDSTGRYAQEIWLPAGQPVKFVVTDSSAVIQFTLDNIQGLNDPAYSGGGSGGTGTINYQIFTATAAQTLFSLSFTYLVAGNQLSVFRNGSRLNITDDYTETTNASFTLTAGAIAGDKITAITFSGAGPAGSTGATGATGGTGPIPQNSQSGPYTLVIGDAGYHIYHPSADTTARTWTIPANASVAFPIGTAVTFVNDTSAGVITLAITSDTLMWAPSGGTGSRTLAANSVATALKVTSTRWVLTGVGIT